MVISIMSFLALVVFIVQIGYNNLQGKEPDPLLVEPQIIDTKINTNVLESIRNTTEYGYQLNKEEIDENQPIW